MAKGMKTALVQAGVVSAETAAANDPTAVNGGDDRRHEKRDAVLWTDVVLYKHTEVEGKDGHYHHRFDECSGEEKRLAFLHYFRKMETIGVVDGKEVKCNVFPAGYSLLRERLVDGDVDSLRGVNGYMRHVQNLPLWETVTFSDAPNGRVLQVFDFATRQRAIRCYMKFGGLPPGVRLTPFTIMADSTLDKPIAERVSAPRSDRWSGLDF